MLEWSFAADSSCGRDVTNVASRALPLAISIASFIGFRDSCWLFGRSAGFGFSPTPSPPRAAIRSRNDRALQHRATFEHLKDFSDIRERAMRIDDPAGAEAAIREQVVSAAHVVRTKMKRSDQREIVIVHAARVDLERGARRTSAEEHHPAAAPHTRERVTPPVDLPGALDHQVGPEAAVEPRNFGRGVARGDVDHAIGAELSRPFE